MGDIKKKLCIQQNQNTENLLKDTVFLSFARKFGDKYSKKIIDTATKTGIDK